MTDSMNTPGARNQPKRANGWLKTIGAVTLLASAVALATAPPASADDPVTWTTTGITKDSSVLVDSDNKKAVCKSETNYRFTDAADSKIHTQYFNKANCASDATVKQECTQFIPTVPSGVIVILDPKTCEWVG